MPARPAKPNHPDMELFEKVLQGQDSRAEGGVPMNEMVPDVDPSSAMYAAHQRSLRFDSFAARWAHQPQIALAALWLDGMAAGVDIARRKAKTEQ